jgi:hypothetical protein
VDHHDVDVAVLSVLESGAGADGEVVDVNPRPLLEGGKQIVEKTAVRGRRRRGQENA